MSTNARQHAGRTQAYLTSGLILILNLKTVHLLQDATLARSKLEKCGTSEACVHPRKPQPASKKTTTPADAQNRAKYVFMVHFAHHAAHHGQTTAPAVPSPRTSAVYIWIPNRPKRRQATITDSPRSYVVLRGCSDRILSCLNLAGRWACGNLRTSRALCCVPLAPLSHTTPRIKSVP